MFEFIGIAVVAWVGYSIIVGLIRAKKSSSSVEYGLEARRIATQELFVPNQYYNYMTTNHIEDLKRQALVLRENSPQFKRTSWPRLLALGLFAWFHRDCSKFHNDDESRIQLFRQLQIEPGVIATTLMQDLTQVLDSHA
jgi:hypothetical protein